MRVGSLCSGYGGLDAALGGDLRWYAEIDESASLVMKLQHPEVTNYGDIKTLPVVAEDVDVITSGDPCQSMSSAGFKLAHDDPRFLWPYVRQVIEAHMPPFVFLENVRNLVSVKGGAVLTERLADLRVLGYACRWTVLGACAIGAPHHRHRWFLRAERMSGAAPEAVRVGAKCGAPRTGGRLLLPTPTTADGLGGPGVSPMRTGGMNLRTAVQLLPSPRATDGSNGGPNQGIASDDIALPSACQPQRWGRYTEAVALWERLSGRPAPEPVVVSPRGGWRLNPALSEWMMGLPEGMITAHVDRNAALRLIGNGVLPAQAHAAWDMLSS